MEGVAQTLVFEVAKGAYHYNHDFFYPNLSSYKSRERNYFSRCLTCVIYDCTYYDICQRSKRSQKTSDGIRGAREIQKLKKTRHAIRRPTMPHTIRPLPTAPYNSSITRHDERAWLLWLLHPPSLSFPHLVMSILLYYFIRKTLQLY